MIENFERWAKDLQQSFNIAMYGTDECDEIYNRTAMKYVSIINQAIGTSDIKVLETIFALFTDEPDDGVLESCFRVLTNMEDDVFVPAFVKSLPTLLVKANYWACDLFEYIIMRGQFLKYIPHDITEEQKLSLIKVANNTQDNSPKLTPLCNELISKLQDT
jgi:hypothetical protein